MYIYMMVKWFNAEGFMRFSYVYVIYICDHYDSWDAASCSQKRGECGFYNLHIKFNQKFKYS